MDVGVGQSRTVGALLSIDVSPREREPSLGGVGSWWSSWWTALCCARASARASSILAWLLPPSGRLVRRL